MFSLLLTWPSPDSLPPVARFIPVLIASIVAFCQFGAVVGGRGIGDSSQTGCNATDPLRSFPVSAGVNLLQELEAYLSTDSTKTGSAGELKMLQEGRGLTHRAILHGR